MESGVLLEITKDLPSKMEIDDTFYSIRFKYGVHTILMFIDSQQKFSEITTSLLDVLRDRFPDGLAIKQGSPETTDIPEGDVELAYALPVNANDLSQGWKNIKVKSSDTPIGKGLRDGCPVAFSFDLDEPEFLVEIPSLDDDVEEEEAMGSDE
ncbi:hypothetical protein CkaCkLH20_10077 [Colletotrichum karsti]|uniref:Uncharacterized protein n=1 Tax=Colletotrichum karsti TaxID=1095194 RepID=A0A9P6LHG2_9PEZI|nr:uncharacterized protein CkaCkLH20_10077 [Colletotrichum karsti]KAF9872580.1 hypothetical protein CkaCkLH20_10077 [Colletotrichum karsti]